MSDLFGNHIVGFSARWLIYYFEQQCMFISLKYNSISIEDMIAGEETGQLVADVAEAWNLIRNSLELYGAYHEVLQTSLNKYVLWSFYVWHISASAVYTLF